MLEELQTVFSPQGYPIGMTLAVMVLALVLVSVMRRMMTLLLRRRSPPQIARMTLLWQIAVLVGGLVLIIGFIAPGWLVVLLASLASALAATALFSGNPISDSVAFLRIRGLHYYRVGDWVTVAEHQYGRVVAILPLNTLLLTPTHGQVSLHNSVVVGAPIVIHRDQTAPMRDDSLPAGHVTVVESGGEEPTRAAQAMSLVLPIHIAEVSLGKTAPLVKRPALGKKSIKLLLTSKH